MEALFMTLESVNHVPSTEDFDVGICQLSTIFRQLKICFSFFFLQFVGMLYESDRCIESISKGTGSRWKKSRIS